VIPVRPDGSKRPTLPTWQQYQEQLPTEPEVAAWWQDYTRGIGIIGGAVSGNLECIDIDRGELVEPWCRLVELASPGLLDRLCIGRTPREPAGYHIRYRCNGVIIPGNQKLASEPGKDPKTGKPISITLVETRGEGGYAIAPGSPASCHTSGRTYEHIMG